MNGGDGVQAGWFSDPWDAAKLRYWDGTAWTEHTAPTAQPVPVADSPPSPAAQVPPPPPVVPPPPPPAPDLPPPPSVAQLPAPPAETTPPAQDGGSEAALPPPPDDPGERPAHLAAGRSNIGVPDPPTESRRGLFGSKKGLEAEVEELRRFVDAMGYGERAALNDQIAQLARQRDELTAQLSDQRDELAEIGRQLVTAREELILQEVGVYDYHHLLEDSVAYKAQLEDVRRKIKEAAKRDGGAVHASTTWTVEGSAAKGRKMVNEFSKLLLRAFNGEADVLVSKMRPYKLEASVDRLLKARDTISRLGSTMNISISDPYVRLRIEELRLTADFLAKKEEEKEAERAEKERLREEAQARKEFEAEKARLLKEQAHYLSALQRIRETGTPEEVAAAEATLADIESAIQGVDERSANVRAGYVYVISNFGAFGPEVVKIGMTRRLEPLDRVRELGDASVPFRYDVHALVFSEDAVSLETRLHQALADRRVNLVNLRREFFYATPAEVKEILTSADGSVLEFIEEPEADEWHQSANARRTNTEPSAAAAHEPIPSTLAERL
jgi:hypothetical protein